MVGLRVIVFVALLFPALALAQSRAVDPDDLSLTVTMEPLAETPYRREMILLTIHGVYKRHITREKLVQPDLEGFNWMQLGEDYWYDSMRDGRPVKNMRRRMAVFPETTGRLRIGGFKHRLTLLDESNKWFEHVVEAEPIEIEVLPEPAGDGGWWFPVRRLQIADNWSNAPDQLAPGEGVLRVIRVSALGASPDMLPPMPELTSPSALIFAHPEKRLVDLTPDGPEAVAFWRWTITPTNGRSAILEPVSFDYFDTVARVSREVVIAPQRVAFGTVTPETTAQADALPPQPRQSPELLITAALLAFAAACGLFLRKRTMSLDGLRARWRRFGLRRALRRGAGRGDLPALRRAAWALDRAEPPSDMRRALLRRLDDDLFGRRPTATDLGRFYREFCRTLG
ncbi:hypothetical protein R5H30_11670 [Sulfitobacter sp. D35]|uniref:hypothetical protein n=1 Tax=Sulfitobacter sp. D35 TaxID=3083252 RepID=UPI00296E98AF|nr:hypothetical protein [Sulfitobacter sp. D35]MDW4498643.1 hypothetical protein [Sulfitobacter sp. D35]